jgi:hypothetical protein
VNFFDNFLFGDRFPQPTEKLGLFLQFLHVQVTVGIEHHLYTIGSKQEVKWLLLSATYESSLNSKAVVSNLLALIVMHLLLPLTGFVFVPLDTHSSVHSFGIDFKLIAATDGVLISFCIAWLLFYILIHYMILFLRDGLCYRNIQLCLRNLLLRLRRLNQKGMLLKNFFIFRLECRSDRCLWWRLRGKVVVPATKI